MRSTTIEKYKKIYHLRYIENISDEKICSLLPRTQKRTIQMAVKYIKDHCTYLETPLVAFKSIKEIEEQLENIDTNENEILNQIKWLFYKERIYQKQVESELKTGALTIFNFKESPYSKHLNSKIKLFCRLLNTKAHLWELRNTLESTFTQKPFTPLQRNISIKINKVTSKA